LRVFGLQKVKPGNGINFPTSGEYVRLSVLIKTDKDEIIFDTRNCKNIVARMGIDNSNILDPILELIGEMSLFERCSIEFNKETIEEHKNIHLTDELIDLINKNERIIFEIEILDISAIKLK